MIGCVSQNEWNRHVALEGAFNFRDLGGYRTSSGGITRRGRLFRSDALHEITTSDVRGLRELKIACVIDLRTSLEIEQSGRGLLQSEPIRYIHCSVAQEGQASRILLSASTDILRLDDLYFSWLEASRKCLAKVLLDMADESLHPIVFHCAGGKDRTGLVAALTLEILGVEQRALIDDYMLTSRSLEQVHDRLRRNPAIAARMLERPDLYGIRPATMERFLQSVHEMYGNSSGWAIEGGLSNRQLEGLKTLLLEGRP